MESVTNKPLKNQPKSEVNKTMAEGMLKLLKNPPACMWKKVLVANAASRSMVSLLEKCDLRKEQKDEDQCKEDEHKEYEVKEFRK